MLKDIVLSKPISLKKSPSSPPQHYERFPAPQSSSSTSIAFLSSNGLNYDYISSTTPSLLLNA